MGLLDDIADYISQIEAQGAHYKAEVSPLLSPGLDDLYPNSPTNSSTFLTGPDFFDGIITHANSVIDIDLTSICGFAPSPSKVVQTTVSTPSQTFDDLQAVPPPIQKPVPSHEMYCEMPAQSTFVAHNVSFEDFGVQSASISHEKPQMPTDNVATNVEQPKTTATSMEYIVPIKVQVLGYVNQQGTVEPLPQPSPQKVVRKTKQLTTLTTQWNCERCSKSFKSKGGFVQHNQQIHSGPTPHACDICGKRFRDVDVMRTHRQRHLMKDKPCKCEECPKQFIRQSDLQRHVNLHHRMSRHCCGMCGKAFDRADHLKNHQMSHANGTVKKYKEKQVL